MKGSRLGLMATMAYAFGGVPLAGQYRELPPSWQSKGTVPGFDYQVPTCRRVRKPAPARKRSRARLIAFGRIR